MQTDSAEEDKIQESAVFSVDNFYLAATTNYQYEDKIEENAYLRAHSERHVNRVEEIPHVQRNVHFEARINEYGDTIDIENETTEPQRFHI